MSAPAERPNFFVLLGLDPDAPWDQARFERELATRRNEWSKFAQAGLPRDKAARAKRYLNLYGEIVRTMGNSATRNVEAANARKLRAAELRQERDAVAERVTIMLAKGYLHPEEVSGLQRDHAAVLASDPELANRIATAEVRQASDSSEFRLSRDQETNLADQLSVAREVSLYAVLKSVDEAVTYHSPREKLLEAADALWHKAHNTKDKSDPALTAQLRLSSIARDVFASDEQRRRHDMSMVIATLQTIVRRFETSLAAAGAVAAAQFELYLEEARMAGVADVDLAKRHFVAHFAAKGWSVDMPAAEIETRLRRSVQCPKCAALNDPGSAACRACRLHLRLPCPNCGDIAPRYGFGCRCGFPVGQRYLVEELVAQARQMFAEHEFGQAEITLDRAARIWALPADRTDPLTEQIHAVRTALDEALGAIREASERVDRLINERRFVAATEQIRSAPDGLPRRDSLLARAEAEVEQARELCGQARLPGTPPVRQAELYLRALRICADLEVARTELNRMPPDPPGHASATVTDPAAGVLLTWTASTHHDVSYLVVQVTGSRLPEPAEGLSGNRRVGTTTGTTFRDRDAAGTPGVPLRYAVFTERSGTFSTPAVTEPVVVAADATVAIGAEDGRVVLTWSVPAGALRVEVSREEVGGGVPVLLPVTGQGRLTDTDVRNGVRYRYTVRAAYPAPGGGLVWSDGRTSEVTPTEPPAPSGPLTVTGSSQANHFVGHKTQLRWSPPDRGIMKVVRVREAGLLAEGDRLPESELARHGRVLGGTPPVIDGWVERDLTVCSYVPVVVADGLGYVGRARRYARAPEPTGVHAEFAGTGILVGWTWPEEGGEVLVGYDADRAPPDPTVASGQLSVGRVHGERTGGCDLRPGAGDRMHVVVATVVVRDGVRYVTSGVALSITRPRAGIEYEVRVSGLLRQEELVLRADRPVNLPALILRGRPGRPPRTPSDGELVMALDPMPLAGRRAIPLPRTMPPESRYRLFTASPVDTGSVRLDPGQV